MNSKNVLTTIIFFPTDRSNSGRRSQLIQEDLSNRSSKWQLMQKGIYKAETVFGNELHKLKPNNGEESGLPYFLVCIIEQIEKQISSEGLYRVSGDAHLVQKLRYIPTTYLSTS